MDNREVAQMVDDLEPKVERLKSLYQQYFMGIEKTPPAILRRDVDRVIYQLRRQRLQNTATRYKFQAIVQRLNTYQQYWQRIMRQIENGTYKRDIQRAAARFGKDEVLLAGGRDAELALRDMDDESVPVVWELSDEPSEGEAYPAGARGGRALPGVWTLPEDPGAYDGFGDTATTGAQGYDPYAGGSTNHDTGAQASAGYDPAAYAAYVEQQRAYEEQRRAYERELRAYEERKRAYEEYQRQQAALATRGQPVVSSAGPLAAPTHAAPTHAAPTHAAPTHAAPTHAAPTPRAQPSTPRTRAPSPAASQPGGQPGASHPDAAPAPVAAVAVPAARASAPRISAPAAQAPVPAARPSSPLAAAPTASVGAAAPPPRSMPAPAVGRPLPPPPRRAPPPPPQAGPSHAGPPPPQAGPAPAAAPAPPPAGAPPTAPVEPAPPPQRSAPRASASRRGGALIGSRRAASGSAAANPADPDTREIYNRYVQARRQAGESTANITYEKLAKSLQAQREALQQQHTGRNVDFEVVSKNGRTMIRPVIK